MDKNSITGMILMCAVIFGFMWLNTPSQAELDAQRRQQDSIAALQAQADSLVATSGQRDTLSAADVERLHSVLASLASADSVAPVITDGGVTLSLDADRRAAGTITLDGDTTVTYGDLLAGRIADPRLNNLAVAAVKRATARYLAGGDFAANLHGTDAVTTIENDSVAVDISNHGGMISGATLKAYKAFGKPLRLFNEGDNTMSFTLANNTQRFETKDLYFTPEQVNDSTVVMSLNLAGGAHWGIRYTLVPGTYMVRMELEQSGMDRIIPTNISTIDFKWNQLMSRHEEGKMFEERNSAIYYKSAGGGVSNLSESGHDDDETQDNIKWMAAKNQFFSTVLIADSVMVGGNFESASIDKDDPRYDTYVKNMSLATSIPYSSIDSKPAAFMVFLGPNRYPLLSSYDRFSPDEDLNLTRLISLGWALFRWINTWIIIPIFTFLGKFINSYGIIILLLTIIIKLILSPLTFKSYMSQAKMRLLAPEIAEINSKYPGDDNAMKRQQETMKLYSLAGASPFGGCLPMMLQMPILIAMFTFFPSSIELRGQAFLWAADLSAPDKIFEWDTNIPIISSYFGNHISLFCLLMTITNITYTYLTMQSQSQQNSMPGMKWMMYLMPIMFLVFFNNYASGLSYYYFISLLITIIQTYACRALVSEADVQRTIAENKAKPASERQGCMGRLAEAQKQQQAALERQQKQQARRNRRH